MDFTQAIKENELFIHSICHKTHIDDIMYDYDDLYQEALIKLYDAWDSYDSFYSPTTFISVVLNNHFKNLIKHNDRQKRTNYIANEKMQNISLDDVEIELQDESYQDFNEKERDTLSKAFLLLKGHKYQVVIENVLKGYSYEQVGYYYGVSKQRIHQIYSEFINEVKELMEVE